MDFLTCKNCGCDSVSPMEVELSDLAEDLELDDSEKSSELSSSQETDIQDQDANAADLEVSDYEDADAKADDWNTEANEFIRRMQEGHDLDKETRFYTCQVCGDNWLSIKETNGTDCEITFIHQMGIKPTLRRVALMTTNIVLNENTVESWEYYFGEDQIDADDWHKRLKGRRQVLKSICSN